MSVFRHALPAANGGACPETNPAWYAVHTKRGAEFQVRDRLTARDIAVFLPVLNRPSQPLFSRYLFARTERRELTGVTGVVRVSGPFAEDDLEDIRSAAAGHAHADRAAGESITVARGPFAGLTGVITRKGARRLMIRASILGRACAVEIGAGDVFGRSYQGQRAAA